MQKRNVPRVLKDKSLVIAARNSAAIQGIPRQQPNESDEQFIERVRQHNQRSSMIREYRCSSCGIKIIVTGSIELDEPVLCQKCDPAFASLEDNKYHQSIGVKHGNASSDISK